MSIVSVVYFSISSWLVAKIILVLLRAIARSYECSCLCFAALSSYDFRKLKSVLVSLKCQSVQVLSGTGPVFILTFTGNIYADLE